MRLRRKLRQPKPIKVKVFKAYWFPSTSGTWAYSFPENSELPGGHDGYPSEQAAIDGAKKAVRDFCAQRIEIIHPDAPADIRIVNEA